MPWSKIVNAIGYKALQQREPERGGPIRRYGRYDRLIVSHPRFWPNCKQARRTIGWMLQQHGGLTRGSVMYSTGGANSGRIKFRCDL